MFAEIVCGPPGCGKTTYCEAKRQFLSVYDPDRPVVIVNLDPANDGIFPYPCDVDVRSLVCHSQVTSAERLGPNGAYLFCADAICQRMGTLEKLLEDALARCETSQRSRAPYIIIDSPGQVEFYIQADVISMLVHTLQKRLCCTVAMVHLLDAVVTTRSLNSYVSGCLLALNAMTSFELPHVNFFSKWDQAEADHASEYLSVADVLENFSLHTKQQGDAPKRTLGLSRSVLGVLDGYGILGFERLSVQDQALMLSAVQLVDNALGNFV